MDQAVEQAINDLAARGTQVLGSQIDDATSNLNAIQQRVAASISDSLKVQVGQALQSFESTMDELAAKCVERWRVAFAGGLTSLARILGEQFVLQAGPEPAPVEADSRNGHSKRLQP
jgi:hypothetical protein